MRTHPLETNSWSVDGEPEHGTVCRCDIRDMERTISAISTIARIVGNSVLEPNASAAQPLSRYTMNQLLGGVESLCDYMRLKAENMHECASMFDKHRARETGDEDD